MPKFILSDESVNRYGFRVKTKGIRLASFLKNPVMFYNHDRSQLPIGKWINIEVKDGKLMAEPEFDTNDEFAMKIKDKVDKGIINSTSIGFDVIALSDDPSEMLPGQRRSTVTESDLFEASIVDIPGNSNAIRMRGLQLSGDAIEKNLSLIIPEINQTPKMEKITAELGLKADATQEEIVAAIQKIKNEQTLALKNEKAVALLVKMGEAKGLKKELVEKLAKADFDSTLEMIESAQVPQSIEKPEAASEGANQARLSAALVEAAKQVPATTPASETKLKFSERLEKDLTNLKAEFAKNPNAVMLAFKEEYGAECTVAELKEVIG